MFGDNELDKLYQELTKLDNRNKPKASAFSFEEDDIGILFEDKRSNKLNHRSSLPNTSKTQSPKKTNQDFLLSLSDKKYSKADQELTLGEYLQKYNKVEDLIKSEQKNRSKYDNPDLEKLVNLVAGNEPKAVKVPYGTTNKNMFISKRVEDSIESDLDRREQKANVQKAWFVGDQTKSKKTFGGAKSKEDKKTVSERIENFSNAKASLTQEKFMSPLSLEKYSTKS